MGARLIALNITDPTRPEPIGQSQPLPGIVHAVLVQHGVAYVGVGTSIVTLDISNLQMITLLGQLMLPGPVTHLALDEDVIVAGLSFSPSELHENGLGSLIAVSVGQPDQLQVLDSVMLPWYVNAMALAGEVVYVSNPADDTFYAVQVNDPTNLAEPVAIPGVALTYSLQARGQTLYVGGGASDVSAWDVGVPSQPQELWRVEAEADANLGLGVVSGFDLTDNHAYLGAVSYHGPTIGVLGVEIPESVPETPDGVVASKVIAQNGLAFFAEDGLLIYDTSDPADVTQIGAYTQPDVWDVATVDGVGVFVAGNAQQTNDGNRLYTVTLPDLNILGQYIDEKRCQQCYSSFVELHVADGTAYIGAADDGLRVVDLTNASDPSLLASLDATNGFSDLGVGSLVTDEWIYTAAAGRCDGRNLTVLDLRDLLAPQRIASLEIDGCIEQLAIEDGVLYAAAYYADREGGVLYSFVRNDSELSQAGTVSFVDAVKGVQAFGDGAIVATSAGLTVISATDPANLTIVAELAIPGGVDEIAIRDDLAFVTTSAGVDSVSELYAIDLSEPAMPRPVGVFHLPAGGGSIAVTDDYVLIGNPTMGLVVLRLN
jgi:hypothetical protein